MSYTPTQWQTGDTITAERLNNMEDGIAAENPFVITLTPTNEDLSGTHDKTVEEISAAVLSGRRIIFEMDLTSMNIPSLRFDANVAQNTIGAPASYSVCGVFVFTDANLLVAVETETIDDGHYVTLAYQLTPKS